MSNNKCNESSNVVEVVYLTTKNKKQLPTHVQIFAGDGDLGQTSIALCEAVYSISTSRIESYIGILPDRIMEKIDRALMLSLDLDGYAAENNEKNHSPRSENIASDLDLQSTQRTHLAPDSPPPAPPEPPTQSTPEPEKTPEQKQTPKPVSDNLEFYKMQLEFYKGNYEHILEQLILLLRLK